MALTRAAIVAEALSWRGTPYRHQASVKGAGCDCLGLVRGVWRALLGAEPEHPPPYAPDWAEAHGREALFEALQRRFTPAGAAAPGDVVLFRMCAGSPMKHAAILCDGGRIVHAYWGRGVVESRFGPFWRRRLGAAFSFPGAN